MHPAAATDAAAACRRLQMGETPLIRAAHNGHLQAVRYLVEQGADVNSLDMVRLGRGRAAAGRLLCRGLLVLPSVTLHCTVLDGGSPGGLGPP